MEIDHPPQRKGYSLKLFIDPKVAEKFICTICKNVLKNAVQVPESTDPKRACQDCYKDNIRYVPCLKRVLIQSFFCSLVSSILYWSLKFMKKITVLSLNKGKYGPKKFPNNAVSEHLCLNSIHIDFHSKSCHIF